MHCYGFPFLHEASSTNNYCYLRISGNAKHDISVENQKISCIIEYKGFAIEYVRNCVIYGIKISVYIYNLCWSKFIGWKIHHSLLWVKSRRDFYPLCNRVERVSYFRVESSGTLGSLDISGSADQPANEAMIFRVSATNCVWNEKMSYCRVTMN